MAAGGPYLVAMRRNLAALAQGADMLEIDLNRTADGKLVILHPCMERQMLGWNGRRTS